MSNDWHNSSSKDYNGSEVMVLASRPFMRFARKFGIGEQELVDAMHSAPDANLGGNVFKFRLARHGEGKSGGARAIVAMKTGERCVLMFGFEKSSQANIQNDDLLQFRKAAKVYLGYSNEEIAKIVREGKLLRLSS